jgi:Lipid A 3-O-deacylase (PagL)
MRTLLWLTRYAYALALFGAAAMPLNTVAQQWTPESPLGPYPPQQTFGIFGEYSPDSSHIVLGITRKRRFVSGGVSFTQRLAMQRSFTLYYMAECRPAVLWSDPVLKSITTVYNSPPPMHTVNVFLNQQPPVLNAPPSYNFPFSFTDPTTGVLYQGTTYVDYGRRYLYAANLSPIGFKLNLAPRARVQPVFTVTGGMTMSFRDLPMFDSSAFNFTFSFGGGLEWSESAGHSLRVEYRVQHLSNAYIGATNPGTDSQLIQATWNWRRR